MAAPKGITHRESDGDASHTSSRARTANEHDPLAIPGIDQSSGWQAEENKRRAFGDGSMFRGDGVGPRSWLTASAPTDQWSGLGRGDTRLEPSIWLEPLVVASPQVADISHEQNEAG